MMSAQAIEEVSTYLTFGLGEETFAINVINVREVLDITDITRIPRTPEYMKGVINLRGGVVPVVDMRIKYGLPAMESTVDTCIIVTEVYVEEECLVIGALADSVKEVLQITSDQIEPPPKIGMQLNTAFIQGIGKSSDEFIIILDVERTFTSDELLHLQVGDDVPATGNGEMETMKAEAVSS